MLIVPRGGLGGVAASQASTTSDGITVTASGSTHTKGSWAGTPLWSATPFDAYGITIMIGGMGTASANIRGLLDVGIGDSGSEVVLIPNLICGASGTWVGSMNQGVVYTFPIFIPGSSRLNCRLQANTASDTCTVIAWLHGQPSGPGQWVGTRVTDYGTNTGTSSGVAHTPGSTNAYAAATQIVESTSNPIRALQLGIDMGASDTTATSMRGMVRLGLGATPNYFASHLPFGESTTVESMANALANMILGQMLFNFPAASDLRLSAMVNGTGEGRGWALYGVD